MKLSSTKAFSNAFALYLSAFIGAGAFIGIGKVLLWVQISQTAAQSHRIERDIVNCERYLAEINTFVTAEQSVSALMRRNSDWKLGLVPPGESSIVRVTTSPERRLASRRNTEIFSEYELSRSEPASASSSSGSLIVGIQ